MAEESRYRILSLDGGGTWALIQVMALMQLHGPDKRGHEVLSSFDLIAANSGGSLVLGGLLEDLPLGTLLNDYFLTERIRKQIFYSSSFFHDPVSALLHRWLGVGPKYRADKKLEGLESILTKNGQVPLNAISSRFNAPDKAPDLLICAYDYPQQRARYFRSSTNSLASNNGPRVNVSVAQAIHASTNAPVNYFDAPARVQNQLFWDGGVSGLNNPVLAAVTEALANGKKRENIVALSLGTATAAWLPPTNATYPKLTQPPVETSLTSDLRRLATSIVGDPPDAATFIAYVALGQPLKPGCGNLVRLNPLIRPAPGATEGSWQPPANFTPEEFKALVDLDMDAVEQDEVLLIQRLATEWMNDAFPNQPVRLRPTPFACEVGHDTFSAGVAHWKQLSQ